MGRTLIGLLLVLILFAGLGTLGWYVVQERVHHQPEYRLSAGNITVPQPPDWIPDQFVEDVLQHSGLNRTGSLLDKTLPQKLTEAFSVHPWVERVEQVIPRYPSGANVSLVYRVPTALVEVSQRGIFLVDRNGVLLPPESLSDTTSDRQYLRIYEIQSMPLGSVGTPWGDQRVQTAAQLVAALRDIAEPLNLAGIIPATETTPSGTRIVCRLRTVANTEIHWGTFSPEDPKTETKKKKLWELHEQFRGLDNVPTTFRDLSRE